MAKETTVHTQKTWLEWFPGKDQSEEIKPAKNVLQDAQHFLAEQWSKLGKTITTELIAVICHKNQSGEPVPQTKEDVLRRLVSTPLEQLSAYVDYEVDKMQSADKNLSQKRKKGLHKRAAKIQDFAITFSRFLQAYSGIVEIVKAADSQYGNVAFAALSLLFATVKIKAETEESIHDFMSQISDRLSDFGVYRRIYPNPELGSMLAKAYGNVIVFARQVTIYYQGSGFARYIYHAWKVNGFQSLEQEIMEEFSRIRIKCEVLLAQKIDHLVKENQEFYERYNTELVISLRKTLELNDYRTEDERNHLKKDLILLKNQFNNDRRRETMDLSKFLMTTDGRDWESPGSMLLLLFGRNENGSTTHHSWLSPIAVELAEVLLDSSHSVAYEGCDPSSTLELGMSHLIFQLLERNPAVIRRGCDLQEIESQLSRKGDGTMKAKALRMALLRIINLHDHPVYIILHRPDVCAGSCPEYITMMLSLIKDATTELKVMVVLRSEFWDVEKNHKEIETHGLDLNKFRRVCINQGLR